MNKVELVGGIVRDPEIRYTTGENAMAIARFTIACQRRFKNSEGNYEADFISCQAFGKTAEFIEKYFKKGSKIGITGRIQTGSYTNKEGQKVYTTDVVVDEVEFVGSKSSNSENNTTADSGFVNVPDGIEEELPFN